MKIHYLILIFIVVLIISFSFYFIPFDEEWSYSLQTIAVILALFVSSVALWYARKEYNQHKKSEKTALLCQYLQRYSNDLNIKKVEEYILNTALLDGDKNIVGYDNNKKTDYIPTIREKEMFMHFFEEIQLLIDDDKIDREVVIDLIGYYVGIFHRIKEFHQNITDYEDERYWKYYLKFVKSIPNKLYE